MSIFDKIAKELGLPKPKLPPRIPRLIGGGDDEESGLPDPEVIKGVIEKAIEELRDAKEIPKDLIGRLKEADEDFRDADRAFRSGRVRRGQ